MMIIRSAFLGALWLAASSCWAQGVSSGTVQITVTPSVTRSLTVQLQGGATTQYDFGTVNLDSVHQGTAPFVVTNTGDVSLTYALQVSSEVDLGNPSFPWTSLDAAGPGGLAGLTDKYRLLGMFTPGSSGIPDTSQYLVKRAAPTLAGPLGAGQFATASQSGAGVTADPAGAGNQRFLWFDVRTPGYTTTIAQKRISVTVIGQ